MIIKKSCKSGLKVVDLVARVIGYSLTEFVPITEEDQFSLRRHVLSVGENKILRRSKKKQGMGR